MILKPKSYHPDLGTDTGNSKVKGEKNYLAKQKFGNKRQVRPPWDDPNPVKYGGKHGMQHMKEMLDTRYQVEAAFLAQEKEKARRADLSGPEREEEDLKKEEEKLLLEKSRKVRLTEMSPEARHQVDSTLEPNERSFLIQPEKNSTGGRKARLPQIFGPGRSPLHESSGDLQASLSKNQLASDVADLKRNTFDDQFHGDGSNSFIQGATSHMSFQSGAKGATFGKRS